LISGKTSALSNAVQVVSIFLHQSFWGCYDLSRPQVLPVHNIQKKQRVGLLGLPIFAITAFEAVLPFQLEHVITLNAVFV